MRTRFWKPIFMLAGFVLIGCYAAAQANVVCTPIGGVIVENFNVEFATGGGQVVLGVISGDLSGGTFFVWPPPGSGDVPAEGVITLASGDTLRVRSQLTVSDRLEGGFRQVTMQVTIGSGTGAYQRASGSFDSHGSMIDGPFAELVQRYQGEVCVPAR